MEDQRYLVDENLYKIISSCYVNIKHPTVGEVFVIYSDNTRETIWTFNPMRYEFDHRVFIGMTKIEAVFHCDRKKPTSVQLY